MQFLECTFANQKKKIDWALVWEHRARLRLRNWLSGAEHSPPNSIPVR
jgi:hypothetical protein